MDAGQVRGQLLVSVVTDRDDEVAWLPDIVEVLRRSCVQRQPTPPGRRGRGVGTCRGCNQGSAVSVPYGCGQLAAR